MHELLLLVMGVKHGFRETIACLRTSGPFFRSSWVGCPKSFLGSPKMWSCSSGFPSSTLKRDQIAVRVLL